MLRKLFLLTVAILAAQSFLFSQVSDTITEKETGRIIRYLASDSLKGRGNITLDILKATKFIGNEYRKAGLQVLPGASGYYIPFHPYGDKSLISMDQLLWNGENVSRDQFSFLHSAPG